MKKFYSLLIICIIIVATCAIIVIWKPWASGPTFTVNWYYPDKSYNGTTIFGDNFILGKENPRIIEVDMMGTIVWEYILPDELKDYVEPGFDVDPLPNGNILFVCPKKGIYEINRSGAIVWSHLDMNLSHDADRLPNGNVIYVWGGADEIADVQVKEVNRTGHLVWSWAAKDHYNVSPYDMISCQGWTHINAVTRRWNIDNLTLISIRNFNFLVLVNKSGHVVQEIGRGVVWYPHDPEVLDSGNILVASQRTLLSCTPNVPNTTMTYKSVLEINASGAIIWEYNATDWYDVQLTRDCNRLPNNNTLIAGTNKIREITPSGEVVWELIINRGAPPPGSTGFFKAERI